MNNEILVALITGGLTFAGVVITNISAGKKMQSQVEKAQAVTDTKVEELTREVRLHNGFAHEIPVIKEQVKNLGDRLEKLERDD